MITWVISAVMTVVLGLGIGGMVTAPPVGMTHQAPDMTVEQEWAAFHAEAYKEHSDVFTALYEGYETRWSKNGRLMMRAGNSGPYKFVKRAV
jgi:hypothetical protein